ncbi:glycoside hydrolase family protein [Mycolicibacterium thermoresistibile]|uniref:Glycoside hydrolase family protein n=1 Tax=Mycolicibacterium thermoresistibile TaxID=1797 RepID=A0A117IL77_MYCTH|nr:glycoside hydrolase family protein [Mycolicibacterium thermoresistibile]
MKVCAAASGDSGSCGGLVTKVWNRLTQGTPGLGAAITGDGSSTGIAKYTPAVANAARARRFLVLDMCTPFSDANVSKVRRVAGVTGVTRV